MDKIGRAIGLAALFCALKAGSGYIEQADRAPTRPEQRQAADYQRLAQSFRGVADEIQLGLRYPQRQRYANRDQAVIATRAANRAALGDRVAAWQAWSNAIQQRLNRIKEAGRFATLQDVEREWRSIAQELSPQVAHGN